MKIHETAERFVDWVEPLIMAAVAVLILSGCAGLVIGGWVAFFYWLVPL